MARSPKMKRRRKQPLRGHAVVVVPALVHGVIDPRGPEADPPQERSLQRHVAAEPPLQRRAEGERPSWIRGTPAAI